MPDKSEHIEIIGPLQLLKILKRVYPHVLPRGLVNHDHVDLLVVADVGRCDWGSLLAVPDCGAGDVEEQVVQGAATGLEKSKA